MTAATIRPPMPLPLLDEMSCYANCAAQALWMLGASDLAGAAAVRAVDRFTGLDILPALKDRDSKCKPPGQEASS